MVIIRKFCFKIILLFSVLYFNFNVFSYNISSNGFEISPQGVQKDLNSNINTNYTRLSELKKYKEQNGGYVYLGNFDDNISMYMYTKNDIHVNAINVVCKYNNDITFEQISRFEYYISNVINLVDSTTTYTDVWEQLDFDNVYDIGDRHYQNNNINYIYSVNKNAISFKISTQYIESENSNNSIALFVNGKRIDFDILPQNISETIFVPLRGVLEQLGADIEWNEKNKELIIYRLDTTVKIKPEYEHVFINDNMIKIESSPKIIENRLMVPLSFISQVINCNIDYDSSTNAIIINN